MIGTTILLAWSGETFLLSGGAIWVRPVAVALSVAQGGAAWERITPIGGSQVTSRAEGMSHFSARSSVSGPVQPQNTLNYVDRSFLDGEFPDLSAWRHRTTVALASSIGTWSKFEATLGSRTVFQLQFMHDVSPGLSKLLKRECYMRHRVCKSR